MDISTGDEGGSEMSDETEMDAEEEPTEQPVDKPIIPNGTVNSQAVTVGIVGTTNLEGIKPVDSNNIMTNSSGVSDKVVSSSVGTTGTSSKQLPKSYVSIPVGRNPNEKAAGVLQPENSILRDELVLSSAEETTESENLVESEAGDSSLKQNQNVSTDCYSNSNALSSATTSSSQRSVHNTSERRKISKGSEVDLDQELELEEDSGRIGGTNLSAATSDVDPLMSPSISNAGDI